MAGSIGMSDYTNVNRTHLRYIPTGSFLRLKTGEVKSRWFGLVQKPVYAMYKIEYKGGEFSATMDVYLTEADTGTKRKITVSPSRYFTYYVIEEF